MIEYPEVITLTKQLNDTIKGKKVTSVFPPVKPHKFCWFNGDPILYEKEISNSTISDIEGFGIFVEIIFSNGKHLCINDGVHPRFFSDNSLNDIPKNYQLLINFADNSCLVFTVAMYGGIFLHNGNYDNEYYIKSKKSFLPTSNEFKVFFYEQINNCKQTMSAKAFLATDQHFPGIGNGVIQDILFNAKINPKTSISSFSEIDKDNLFSCTVKTLSEMTQLLGRNTEIDIYGKNGSYKTLMSKDTYSKPCPICGSSIIKETYLGGSVYYCPNCQPLRKR